MKSFSFSAFSSGGTHHQGELEGVDPDDVVERLARRGWTVTSVTPTRSAKASKKSSLQRTPGGRARQAEALLSEWARLLRVGLTIDQAVSFSIHSHAGSKLGLAAASVESGLKAGRSLERSLGVAFPALSPSLLSTIGVGEASGGLPETLERLSTRIVADRSFTSEIRTALLYPVFVLVTAGGVLTVLLALVVPSIAGVVMQSGHELSWNAAAVFRTGLFLQRNASMGIAGLIAVLLAVLVSMRSAQVGTIMETLLSRLPVVGRVQTARNAAQLGRDLATQLRGGLPLVEAIGAVQASLPAGIMRLRVPRIRRLVSEGRRLSEALSRQMPEARALPAFVRIGEETGRLSKLLDDAAEHYEAEARQLLKHVSALATPVITLVTGLIVGAVVLSVMGALVSLNDVVLK